MLIDPEIVVKAQSGDELAFGVIIRTYRKRILGTVYRVIGRSDEVEDVGQEVFIRLYRSLKQLRAPQVFEPWLYRLTINACYDHLRRKRRNVVSRMADLSEEQVVALDAALSKKRAIEDGHKQSARELLDLVLSRVSDADRKLLTLKGILGLSLKELSVEYKVSTNVLKVRLFRARKRALRAYEALVAEAKQRSAQQGGKSDES